jgi:soluble P-type ATPase
VPEFSKVEPRGVKLPRDVVLGDSRGSVMTRCKLLKYKTKEDMEVAQSDDNGKSVIVEELGQEYRLGASSAGIL